MGITCQRAHYGDLSWGFKIFNVGKCALFSQHFQNVAPPWASGRTPSFGQLCTGRELTARGNYAFKAASTRSGVNGM